MQNEKKSIDIQNAGKKNDLQVWNTNSGWFQIFKYEADNIVNIQNQKVLDVAGGKDAEGQKVLVWALHNGLNQRWKILYLDNKEEEQDKGWDKDYGLFRNRPFFIKSRMKTGRVIEVLNNKNIVIKN